MADVTLIKPLAGTTQTITPKEGDRLVFEFDAADATLARDGNDLILSFEDGASVKLSDFYNYSSENLPNFVVAGEEISGKDFFEVLGEDLMPAAGTTQAVSSGNSVNVVNTSLQDGLDSLNGLDQVAAGSAVQQRGTLQTSATSTRIQKTSTTTQNEDLKESQDSDTSHTQTLPKINVTIHDGGDGTISKSDLGGPNGNQVKVEVSLEEGIEPGDKIVIKQDNVVIFDDVVDADMVENGVEVWVDVPTDGDVNVEATVTTDDNITSFDDASSTPNIPQPDASISLDSITADNILNAAEAGGFVNITGSVGGDVKPGDIVTITVNGNNYSGSVNNQGEFNISVSGKDLAQDGNIKASVTTSNVVGDSVTASTNLGYVVDTQIEATIEINDITADNIINAAEAKQDLPVSGKVTGDFKEGDTVTLKVNGQEYTTEVNAAGEYTVDVKGSDLAAGGEIEASITVSDKAGNTLTVDAKNDFEVDTQIEATIEINDITADNIINAAEAKQDLPVSGKVTGDFKEGDTVTLKVNGQEYTTEVNAAGEYTVDVKGSDLAAGGEIEASITVSDKAGNTLTVDAKNDFEVDTQIGGDLEGEVSASDDNLNNEIIVENLDLPQDASYDFTGNFTVGDANNPFGSFSVNNDGDLVFVQNEAYKHDRNSDSDTIEVKIPVKDASGNTDFVSIELSIEDTAPEASSAQPAEFEVMDGVANGKVDVDFGGDMDGATITISGGGTLSYGVTWNAEDGEWVALPTYSADIMVEASHDGTNYIIQIGDVTMTSPDNKNWDVSFPHGDSAERNVDIRFKDGDGDSITQSITSINDKPTVGDVIETAVVSETQLDDNAAGSEDASVIAQGSVELSFGKDGGDSFAWNTEGQPDITTSEGTEVTWVVDGDVLKGMADGDQVLSVTMEKDGDGNYTGDYTVELNDFIEHSEQGQDSSEFNFSFTITDSSGDSTNGSVNIEIEDSAVSLTPEAENLHFKAGDGSAKQASDYFDEGTEHEGGSYSVLGANEVTEIEDGTTSYEFDWGVVNMNTATGEYTVEGNGSGDGSFDIQYEDADGDTAKTNVAVENSIVVVDISIDSVKGFMEQGSSDISEVVVTGTVSTVDTTNESNTMTVTLEYEGVQYDVIATSNGDGTYGYTVNIPSDNIINQSTGEIAITNGITTSVEIRNDADEMLASDSTEFSYSYFNKSADVAGVTGTNNVDIIEGILSDTASFENKTTATNIGSATSTSKQYDASIETMAGDDVINFEASGTHAYNVVSLGSNTVTLDTGTGDDSVNLDAKATLDGWRGVVSIKAEGDSAQNIIDLGAGDDSMVVNAHGADNAMHFAMAARDRVHNGITETFNKIDLGSGDDTLYMKGELDADGGKNIIEGGTGNDHVTLVGANTTYTEHTLEAFGRTGQNLVDLGEGDDTLIIQNSGVYGGGLGEEDRSNMFGDALNAFDSANNTIKMGEGNDSLTIEGDIHAESKGTNVIELGSGDDSLTIEGDMDAITSGSNVIDLGTGNDHFSFKGELGGTDSSSNTILGGEGDDTFDMDFSEDAKAYLDGGEGYDAFIYEVEGNSFIDYSQVGSINIGGADDVQIKNFESITTGSGDDLFKAGDNVDLNVDSGLGFDIIIADGGMTADDMSDILQNSLNTEMFIFSNDSDVTSATSTEDALGNLKGVEKSENGEVSFGDNWTAGEEVVHNGQEFQSFTDEDTETTVMIAKMMLENTNN